MSEIYEYKLIYILLINSEKKNYKTISEKNERKDQKKVIIIHEMKNYIIAKVEETEYHIKKSKKTRENQMELQEILDEMKNNIELFFATDR